MSLINTAVTKQPFKLIEIPLNKFQNEAIPYHETLLESHKNAIQKHIKLSDNDQLNREIQSKKRVIRQLKDLMYELDTLRTQVEDCDLNKFDGKTLSLRKTILELISNYARLEMEASDTIQKQTLIDNEDDDNETNIFGASQLQIQEDLSDVKLQEQEHTLKQVEALRKDIEDVHDIFTDLNQIVIEQKDHVNGVEMNVEVANENVNRGFRELLKAAKLKKAAYPVAGAFIGTVVGGPIGSVAGLKIGGLAAVACGFAGYLSGRFIKKVNDDEISNSEIDLNTSLNDTHDTIRDKKDI